MQHYFIWNGVDSRAMGVWVESLPPITRPPMRYKQVTIPGRAGALTIREDRLTEATDGADTYETYTRDCKIMPAPGADIGAILRWLSPGYQADVVFSSEPARAQRAEILDQFELAHAFANQRRATVRFLCEPFKGVYPRVAEEKIVVGTLEPDQSPMYNPGDVIAWPRIAIRGTGSVSVTIEGISLTLSDFSGAVIADCAAGFAYTGTEVTPNGGSANSRYSPAFTNIVPAKMYGDFPYLRIGANNIEYSGNITMLAVSASWRYL